MKSSLGRKLEDLVSVGPAIRRDFELLGIHTVARLAQHEAVAATLEVIGAQIILLASIARHNQPRVA